MDREALIHFISGAIGGTAGTVLTFPLEVIKTRLQSSEYGFNKSGEIFPTTKPSTPQLRSTIKSGNDSRKGFRTFITPKHDFIGCGSSLRSFRELFRSFHEVRKFHTPAPRQAAIWNREIVKFTFNIIQKEGFSSLYKGLLPTLVGMAPSKAVYFYTYSLSKRFCNELDTFVPNTAIVHMLSAGFGAFVTATATNPIWVVKTRLQLHHGPLTVRECIRRIYQQEGIKGYLKGVTASYIGISETVIQFVMYEYFRARIDLYHSSDENKKFFNFMLAGGCAKFFACIIAYPHEVVRTRLREEESKAKGFFRTLTSLYGEKGVKSLYRGLSVQLLRSVPNTAITMGAYETVVYVLHTYLK